MKFLNWLFGSPSSQKPPVRNPQPKEAIDPMVGDPVISFVKCLNNNPKRFKLSFHKYAYAVETGFWGEIYDWMSKDNSYTGYAKLLDRQNGDEYYGIVHRGKLYSVKGLKFSLNGWELSYIMQAFMKFRLRSKERKERILLEQFTRQRRVKEDEDKLERLKLMEKFQ